MIETRLLQQFIAVAEELHFNRAAVRLHMAQPPLSQAIRRLEGHVGAPLFERNNRRVVLTPAGTAFLQTARQILATLDEGLAHTRRVAEGVEGHLTMGFIHIAAYAPLLQALRSFRQACPGVSFSLKEATTQEQVADLESGAADIGFMRRPGTSTPSLHWEVLLREPLYVALPLGHRLADQDSIPMAALHAEAFVASPRPLGQGFHDQLISLCQAAGFVPRIVQQARQLQTLVALVASGFGIALLPASSASMGQQDVVFRPVRGDMPDDLRHVDLLMAWNPGKPSDIRDRLIAQMRAAFESDPH